VPVRSRHRSGQNLADLEAHVAVQSFCLFRFNKRKVTFVDDGNRTWVTENPPLSTSNRSPYPTFFEIDVTIPLPDGVPNDYLVASTATKKARTRKRFLGWTESMIANPDCDLVRCLPRHREVWRSRKTLPPRLPRASP